MACYEHHTRRFAPTEEAFITQSSVCGRRSPPPQPRARCYESPRCLQTRGHRAGFVLRQLLGLESERSFLRDAMVPFAP